MQYPICGFVGRDLRSASLGDYLRAALSLDLPPGSLVLIRLLSLYVTISVGLYPFPASTADVPSAALPLLRMLALLAVISGRIHLAAIFL